MFVIKEVYIKGCIPFSNVGVTELHYLPNERLQYIIGSNGSGKTTLIKMLIPHVPKSTLFTEEGEYKLVIDVDGSEYVLHYILSPKARFSFTINGGKDLNDGGTGVVQKKLIEQYIRLDQDVINILLGLECFSKMTPSRRKYWMGRLSPTNVDFIVDAFTKVNDKLKTTNSNIQFLQRKILANVETLNSLEDDSDVRSRHNYYIDCLDKLYPLKSKIINIIPLDELAKEVDGISTEFINATKKIPPSIFVNGKVVPIDNKDLIVEAHQWATNQYEISKQSYISKADELTHLEEHTGIIENSSSEEELVTQIRVKSELYNSLVAKLESTYAGVLAQYDGVDVGSILDTLTRNDSALFGDIVGACTRITPDPDNIFNRENYTNKQDYLTNLLSDKALLSSEIANARNIIIGCNNAEHVHCKRCDNKWIPGYDEGEVKRAEELVKHKTEHLNNVLAFIELAQDWIDKYNDWVVQFNILNGILSRYPILSDIMSVILSPRIIRENPKYAHVEMNNYLDKITQIAKIQNINNAILSLKGQLESLVDSKQYGYDNLLKRLDVVKLALEVANADRIKYQSLINVTKLFLSNSDIYIEQTNRLNGIIAKVGNHAALYKERLEAQMVDNLIAEIQIALGKTNEGIKRRDDLVKIIAELENNLQEEKKYLEHYKLLADGLNPTTGILAEQLSVSINAIVDGINTVIGKIWKSDLYIQSCGIEAGELNYQFPFNMVGCKDVSDGSSGQRDIVDLAFKIMVYHLLKLHQFPLFLDELGALFDRSHKIALTRYISDCIENGVFSQVFYISHAVEQYIGAGASDINVLCQKNVALPEVYNTQLTLL